MLWGVALLLLLLGYSRASQLFCDKGCWWEREHVERVKKPVCTYDICSDAAHTQDRSSWKLRAFSVALWLLNMQILVW